jgi:hypothetical protein
MLAREFGLRNVFRLEMVSRLESLSWYSKAPLMLLDQMTTANPRTMPEELGGESNSIREVEFFGLAILREM